MYQAPGFATLSSGEKSYGQSLSSLEHGSGSGVVGWSRRVRLRARCEHRRHDGQGRRPRRRRRPPSVGRDPSDLRQRTPGSDRAMRRRQHQPGDGCNQLCQQEANWDCTTPGQPCVFIAVCGNGLLTSDEACDDGNKVSGDGCSADCKTVEPGWQCRVPGKKCVPLCGDGVHHRHREVRRRQRGQRRRLLQHLSASSRARPVPRPASRASSRCAATARPRPARSATAGPTRRTCPPAAPARTACSTATAPAARRPAPRSRSAATPPEPPRLRHQLWQRQLETGEDCDDGNLVDGDGCSSACKLEGGFTCTPGGEAGHPGLPAIDQQRRLPRAADQVSRLQERDAARRSPRLLLLRRDDHAAGHGHQRHRAGPGQHRPAPG